ncbi:hypothetical protein N7E81_09980 [Reichenbachiella carrageenanivorans]|uniref:IPT/TIG domain-containing protein n=1 Tax=Reichenbachiella carrageenanivorans TaxID=2979869 RepID=A0ABY6CUV0_9BACT|nr:hypothetical protein [Reichenbachiella carrageenanivorans]UXX77696.1 hypothetical protein N7E81_09980 [Reichenbachiella carrageenanivorans]
MKAKQLLYSTITFIILAIVSCTDEMDNGGITGDPAIFSGVETVDFGDIVAGQTATVSTYVIGTGIDDGLALTVEGEGYLVSRDHFRIVTDTSFVDITIAPDLEAALGDNPGTITLSAGNITKTISLSSTVLTASIFTYEEDAIDMGDILFGTTESKTVTVEGQYISGTVDITTTGTGFSVSPASFTEGNGPHEITVTYAASPTASAGEVTGEVVFSYGDGLTSVIPVVTNITLVAPEPLTDGTVVYANEFDFPGTPADDDPFVLADLEGLSTTLYEGVSASYDLVVAEGGAAGKEVDHAMCVETISGTTADEGTGCNTSATLKQLGTKVTISLAGLPQLEADYTLTFWARPAATSEREFVVNFGGTEFKNTFNGDASNKFYKFEVEGSSDEDGKIVFDFANNTDNTFRGIDFDHVEIVAGGI